MRYDDDRAVEVGERELELLDRLEVEVVGRLVEDEAVDAPRRDERELGARPLAGRERGARAADVVRAEAELREQRPRVLFGKSRGRSELDDEPFRAREARSLLVDRADDDAGADPTAARRK